MYLHTIAPAEGAKTKGKRVGRGIGSGSGKTCGTGHKGLKSRSGGTVRPGFEGGQMPLQRRLPKFGFTCPKTRTRAEITLYELAKINQDTVDLLSLKQAGIVGEKIVVVKVVLSGELDKAVNIKGLRVTKGARNIIESLGGTIE